jgi:hypothetical protein
MGYRAMNSCISMQLDALTKGTLTAEFFERGGGRRSIFCPEETTGNHIYNYKMSYCVEKIDNYEREANAIYDSLTRLNGCYNILSDETNKYQDAISNQIISDLLATGEDGQLINDMCNFLQLYLNRIAFFIQSFNLGTAENRIFSEHVWKRVEIITNVIVRGCVKSHYLRTSNVQEEKREDDINNIFNCVITEFRRAKTLIIPLKELRRILSKGKAKVNTDSFDSYIAEFKKRTSNNKPWIFIDSEGNCQLNNPIENVDERFNKSERIKKSNLKDAKGVTCKDGKYKKWYSAIDVYKYKLELIQDKERAFYFIPENKDMRFNKDEAMQNLELTQEQIEENVVATDGKFKEWWKELGYNSFDAMVLKNNEIGDRDAKTAQTLQQYLDCMEPRVKQESGESGEQGEESGEQNIMEI